SFSIDVYRSYLPEPPPILNWYAVLMMTSPDQVVPDHWKAVLVINVPAAMGTAAMRMSPNRASPSTAPVVPSGWPPSLTTPTFRFALAVQVSNARRISRSHVAVGATALSVRNRLLV